MPPEPRFAYVPRTHVRALDPDNMLVVGARGRSVHSGVRGASEIRVLGLQEDFPWTKPAMEALEGLIVPCSRKDLVGRWTASSVMDRRNERPSGDRNKHSALAQQGLLDAWSKWASSRSGPMDGTISRTCTASVSV